MNKTTVTVIIPIYNTEKYLKRCVDSVLNQSFKGIEIILVDDGSKDNSGKIADEYASQFNNIKVIHQENKGLAEARRAGIIASSGEYIMHVDSDDDITTDAVKFLYNQCLEFNLDIAYGAANRIIDGKIVSGIKHPFERILTDYEFLKYLLDLRCICASWGCMSRKSIWTNNVFPDKDIALPSEDVYINIKLSRYSKKVGLSNHIVYNYYYNPLSLSSTGKLSKQHLWKIYFQKIYEELDERQMLLKVENKLHELEINRLSLFVFPIDKSDKWIQNVINYNNKSFSTKTKILQIFIKYPFLRKPIYKANRYLKKILRLKYIIPLG